jgi:hypothetical protein
MVGTRTAPHLRSKEVMSPELSWPKLAIRANRSNDISFSEGGAKNPGMGPEVTLKKS